MNGFVSRNHSPAKRIFSLLVCSPKGSSFIIKYNGHVENLDDLKMGTPSVFYNSNR